MISALITRGFGFGGVYYIATLGLSPEITASIALTEFLSASFVESDYQVVFSENNYQAVFSDDNYQISYN